MEGIYIPYFVICSSFLNCTHVVFMACVSLNSSGRAQSAGYTDLIFVVKVKDRTFPILPINVDFPAEAGSSDSPKKNGARTRSTSNMSSGMSSEIFIPLIAILRMSLLS